MHPGRQGGPALPELLRPDQPEGRILGEAFSIIHVLVPRQSAVDRLPDQVGERELRVRASRISQVLCDEGTEAQPLVQFADEDQAAIGGNPGSLELDLQRGVERELKGLVLGFTHWVCTSPAQSSRSNPYQ